LKISLRRPFKSVPAFEAVSLQPFTVVVGLNGTGKSQLLEALQNGDAECDVLDYDGESGSPGVQPKVVRLTNASLTLHSDMFDSSRPHGGAEVTEAAFNAHRQTIVRQYQNSLESMIRDTPLKTMGVRAILATEWSRLSETLAIEERSHVQSQLRSTLDGFNGSLVDNATHGSDGVRKSLMLAGEALGIERRLITYEAAKDFGSWGDYAPFDSKLPRLFAGYRSERLNNARKSGRRGEAADGDWLTEEQFEAKFGRAPWEQLSDILRSFGLNYRIAPPGPRLIDTVSLFFERLDDEDGHVDFKDLSAGEKVHVILAVALLNVDPLRAVIQRPELLLLDEIDASLHPTVLHQWMDVLQEKVVGELGIPCILTTHSPITVALAPEGSLFDMERRSPPLRSTDRRTALNRLTVGLPALEVEFTLRRQVFVEADVDAQAYDRLFHLTKAELPLRRSLSFLSTGVKKDDGSEEGTGCDAVRKVVSDLAGFGSLSTLGLLDWDGKRTSENRIVVLGEGEYYAFDNLILHPLLIGMLLIREGKNPDATLPRFGGAAHLDVRDLQRIADSVQTRMAYPAGSPNGRTTTRLLGNQKIGTDLAFCRTNGHAVEEALKVAFAPLNAFSRRRGQLALTVVDKVLGDLPQLCPGPIAAAFETLANRDL